MERRNVEFMSDGSLCRAWLYTPDDIAGKRSAGIVMAHGFSGVKEMDLPRFAERFAAAGFTTLVFDYRSFGESEGEPRGQLFPHHQIEDYRNAVTFLSLQPEVDPDRIGVWGTSFSGGHVLHLGAFDRRLRAVVSQVPARSEYERLTRQSREAPSWRNFLTTESLEKILEYSPGATIRWIAPTPLLLIVAGLDMLTPPDLTLDAYHKAGEPKSLLWLRCKHHDVYDVPTHFEQACGAAVRWFTQHIGARHA
jgi:fermentation-respiration switch protein FrsA (DUF1100 family)